MYKILKTFLLGFAFAGLCLAACSEKATSGSGVKPKPKPDPTPEVEDYDLINFPDRKGPKTVGEGVVNLFIRSGNSNWGDMHSKTKSTLTSYPTSVPGWVHSGTPRRPGTTICSTGWWRSSTSSSKWTTRTSNRTRAS